ncbi:MAG: SH3 domain-containing protein [Lachnospiraceae bacterium]|nr:SH3 domain-containing protein [Lachnospiraceae bacterium]
MKKMNTEDIKEFIIDHYQYFAVGVLFVVLVIVLAVFSIHKKDSDSKADASTEESVESDALGTEPIPVPENAKLEQNAYEDINSFFNEYYEAVAEGDTDKMAEMGNTLDEEDKAKIQVKAGYTEDYENMSCYTKPGPEDNSYIVFVYYEIKYKNIDSLAPGLSTFYLCTNSDGSYYLKDIGSLPQNMKDYITEIANQSDVQNLLAEVDKLYATNTESDPTLAAFMDSLQTKSESAAAKVRDNGGTAEEVAEENATDTGAEVRVKTTDAVRIRSGATTDEDNVIGKAAAGDTFVRISEDGEWSKIKYKDGEAYIKSEFLTTAEGDTVVGGEVQNADNAGGEENGGGANAETAAPAAETAASGKITVNEAVTIRSGASTDSNKLGSAYKGDTYELTGETDGWYKINYNGQAAYIKSDYCTKK